MSESAIWNYLKSQGLTDCGVAGLMGNLYAESGLNPRNLQNSYEKSLGYDDDSYTLAVDNGTYTNFVNDSAGYGLAQWTYWSRKQALLAYCKASGASIGSLDTQLGFLMKELSEGYQSVLRTLKSTDSVLEASNTVLLNFERPADQSVGVQRKRAEFGQAYYDKFAGKTQNGGVISMTAVEMLLKTARAEIGYLEKNSNSQLDDKTANAGYNNWTKYARDLDKIGTVYNGPKNGYAWCDMFVDWCFITTFGLDLGMKLLCQPYKGAGAGCTYSAQYYRNNGQFHANNPQPGDQIFFKDGDGMGHTGIVEKVEGGKVYTIEGNTSSAAGVVANGGSVNRKSYNLNYSKIGGYGRPNWSLVPNTTEEDDDMDVKRFKELWREMRSELQDNDAGTWSEEAREWAKSTGLVAGTSDKEFNGAWEDLLTREQLVTVLYRFAKMIGQA